MQRRWSLCFLLLAVVLIGACSKDPETAKREYVASGDKYAAEKKYPEAIVQYKNALQQDAKFGDARLKLTDAYLASGDLRNAVVESVRAADSLPRNVDAQLRAGSLLLFSQQFGEAKDRALAALAQDPKNPKALILLGNALAGLKDLDGALEQVQQAVNEDPKLTVTYTNLGDLYAAKGDKEAAERAFKNAVDLAPRSADAHLAYANFVWAQGRVQDTERELKAAADLDPKSVVANRALATFYTSQNRYDDAQKYLEAYVNIMRTPEARLLLADFYVNRKNVDAARKVLTELSAEKAAVSPATVRLALLDFREGHKAEAYSRLEQFLKTQPKNEDALQQQARMLMLDGKNEQALAVTNTLIGIEGDSATNRYLQGLALEATGSLDDAAAAYLEVLKTMPSAVPAQERLAAVYLRQRKAKDALGYADQVVRAQPRSMMAHYLHAQALLQTGDVARAEQELVAVAKATPTSPEVYVWLGVLYEAKHDAARARQSYQKAFDLQPSTIPALAGLVSIDLSEKQPAAAIARIESQLSQHPNDPQLLNMHALALMTTGDLPKAEAAYRKLIEVSPENMEAYGRLATIYIAENRLDEARKSYEQVLTREPKSVAALTMVGTILGQQNKTAEARTYFERALEADPHTPLAANDLAWDYANNGGNLDVALQLAQTAKATLPENASITDTLGWVYYKKGLSSLAVTTLRQASTLDGSNANIHYHLGLALIQQGDKAAARKALDQAVRLKPALASDDEFKRALAGTTAS